LLAPPIYADNPINKQTSNNFKNIPFKYHRYRINDIHSIVCDSEGMVHSKYSKFDSLTDKRKSEKEGEGR
jgi:hypothetical protein